MGHLNIVLLLLQNGASPDVTNIVSMAWVRITTGGESERIRVGVCVCVCVWACVCHHSSEAASETFCKITFGALLNAEATCSGSKMEADE